MLLAEIKHRKFNFLIATMTAAAAICIWLTAEESLANFDQNTEAQLSFLENETNAEMIQLENDIRKTMKGLGFNVFLFPKGEEIWQIKERGYSEQTLSEDSVHKLAESKIVTVNHLLPQLSKRVRWEEQNRSILLVGVEGQVPIAHRSKKKPIMNPLTLGTINLGYDLHKPLGLKKGDQVILCGNAYMGDLVHYLDARVLPATSCIVGTEPLTEEQIQQTLVQDVAVCDSRTALDYYRLSADKRLLFGGLANYSGLDPANTIGIMRAKMEKVFPSLRDVSIDYGWSGRMGISVRRMPQIGRIKNSNVLYISGYSGHGVAPTHMTGRILAEAVSGNTYRFDIMNKMFHMTWPGGKLFRRPFMALGMMWYKALDAI